jgi:alpha-L-fucosidase
MNYITFITRHHDGFSNWDTKQSDWKITNSPYGKDALKQLADECHKQGIKLFCYYSLLDWSRDDYQYETGRTGHGTGRTKKSNWDSYINFMKAQLTELLTQYGEISGIWFDGHWDQMTDNHESNVDWHYNEIYKLIHTLQPKCIIGNNHHIKPFEGEDFQMFEKDLPGENTTGFGGSDISALPLETCETMNNSWGFNLRDTNYKSTKTLIHYIVNAAGRNANFLLNIGPMPNGVVQPEFTDTLKRIGDWMNKNGETYFKTRGNIISPQDWGVITRRDNTLYVHILKNVKNAYIFIPALQQKILKATLFGNGSNVKFTQQKEGTFIYLDGIQQDDIDTIIQLAVK